MQYRKSGSVVCRKIRGEHVLVPITSSSASLDSIFTLNPTASLIWEQACAGADQQAITRMLNREFDVDEPAAEEDVTRILGELLAIGALEAAG